MALNLTAMQRMRLYWMLFNGRGVKPRAISKAMTYDGTPISPKQVSQVLSRTPFGASKLMTDAEFKEHRAVVLRNYNKMAAHMYPVDRHRDVLRSTLSDCAIIQKRHSWLKQGAPARMLQAEQLQAAGKAVSAVGQINTVLEYFTASSALLDKTERDAPEVVRNEAQAHLKARIEMARTISDLHEGSMITPIRSADLEAAGGGGFSGRSANDHQIDCGKRLAQLTRNMPLGAMRILSDCLLSNQVYWADGNLTSIGYIKLCLDIALFNDRQVSQDELTRRWPCLCSIPGELAFAGKTGRLYARANSDGEIDYIPASAAYADPGSRALRKAKSRPA